MAATRAMAGIEHGRVAGHGSRGTDAIHVLLAGTGTVGAAAHRIVVRTLVRDDVRITRGIDREPLRLVAGKVHTRPHPTPSGRRRWRRTRAFRSWHRDARRSAGRLRRWCGSRSRCRESRPSRLRPRRKRHRWRAPRRSVATSVPLPPKRCVPAMSRSRLPTCAAPRPGTISSQQDHRSQHACANVHRSPGESVRAPRIGSSARRIRGRTLLVQCRSWNHPFG